MTIPISALETSDHPEERDGNRIPLGTWVYSAMAAEAVLNATTRRHRWEWRFQVLAEQCLSLGSHSQMTMSIRPRIELPINIPQVSRGWATPFSIHHVPPVACHPTHPQHPTAVFLRSPAPRIHFAELPKWSRVRSVARIHRWAIIQPDSPVGVCLGTSADPLCLTRNGYVGIRGGPQLCISRDVEG
ncbi:hypothetical protein FA13DRAFT_1413665 [Coprinellus micaceus]|uniref:Uncharacterized protein n=1 Tax=Coprinellus micaceus TaxID=71717 RepID=A0A4Y7SQB6_COPMI|nr:hypothetical protein FA13DRAFT_1413665 [Coprinellus micaceus]